MNGSRLMILALVVALTFPSALFQPAVADRGAGAMTAVPAAAAPASSAPGPQVLAAAKHHPQRDRKQRNRPHGSHKQQRQHHHKKHDRVSAGPATDAQTEKMCRDAGMIYLPQSGLCTHGPDPAPPGTDPTISARPLPAAMARGIAAETVCDGDGQSGPRVQVLYAYASGGASRYGQFLTSFRAWTAEADTIMQESAAEAGGSRHFRFVTTGCEIDVQQVSLTPAGVDNFDTTIDELQTQGFIRSDRKYLIFVDTTSAGICGIATRWEDDSPSQANWNNYGPSFARVDAGCWDAHTAAHEMMHNLGAVNDSAPNSSRAGHCIDEYDVMCYPDAPNTPPMRYDCNQPAHENRYDCNHNDYFHPAPPSGNYLATHWNAADNRFLVGGGDGGDDDGSPPIVSWVSPVGTGGTYETESGTISLEVTASDGSGINRVEFKRYDATSEMFVPIATDRAVPFTATLDVPDLNPGFNQVSVRVYDGAGDSTFTTIWVQRTEPNPQPPVVTWTSPVGDGETYHISAGTVALEATATDASGIDEVQFWWYDDPVDEWIAIATDDTAPYTASVDVADLRFGSNYVTADAYDVYENRTTAWIWIERTAGDATPPTPPVLSLTEDGGNDPDQRISGTTLYYNPGAGRSGSFRVSATTSDSESGIASVTFPAVFGGDGATDTVSAYTQTYDWSAGASASGAKTVTATNGAGLTASSTFTVTPDTTRPTAAIASPGAGATIAAGTAVSVNATDALAGVARVEVRFCAGSSCVFGNGTAIGSDDSAPYNVTWDTLPDAGPYTLVARATDNVGNSADSSPRTVRVGNRPPTDLSPGGPYSVDEGGSVVVTAAASDPDGDPLAFDWDLDANDEFETPGKSATFAAATLDGPVTRPIHVRACDAVDCTIADGSVSIRNVAPSIAHVTNSGPSDSGDDVTIAVTASDPAGLRDPLTYEFDCDDNGQFEIGPQAAGSARCTFAAPGGHTVRVRVRDGDGGADTATTTVSVGSAELAVTCTASESQSASLSGAACDGRLDTVWASQINKAKKKKKKGKKHKKPKPKPESAYVTFDLGAPGNDGPHTVGEIRWQVSRGCCDTLTVQTSTNGTTFQTVANAPGRPPADTWYTQHGPSQPVQAIRLVMSAKRARQVGFLREVEFCATSCPGSASREIAAPADAAFPDGDIAPGEDETSPAAPTVDGTPAAEAPRTGASDASRGQDRHAGKGAKRDDKRHQGKPGNQRRDHHGGKHGGKDRHAHAEAKRGGDRHRRHR